MNFSRGMYRLWAAAAIGWSAFVAFCLAVWMQQYTPTFIEAVMFVSLMVGVPTLFLLAVTAALVWIVQGFRSEEPPKPTYSFNAR